MTTSPCNTCRGCGVHRAARRVVVGPGRIRVKTGNRLRDLAIYSIIDAVFSPKDKHMKLFPVPFALLLLMFLGAATRLPAQVADEPSTLRLAQVYEQSGKWDDALRFYQILHDSHPANPSYFDGVRRMLMQLKRYDEVITLLRARIGTSPREVMNRVHLGTALYRKGDTDGAVKAWDDAITLEPQNAGVYQAVSDEALACRMYPRAVEVLQRGRDVLRSPRLFVMEIARAYTMDMKFDKAMEEYIRYMMENPGAIWSIQQHIAQFSEIPAGLEAALRVTRRAADDNPSDATIRTLLAWLYMEGKDYASARTVYTEMDRIRGTSGLELFAFAQRAYNDKAYEPAMKAFADVAAQYPRAGFASEAEFLHARCAEELALHTSDQAPLIPGDTTHNRGSEAVAAYRGVISLYEDIAREAPGTVFGVESRYRIAYITYDKYGDADAALKQLEDLAPMRRNVMGRVDAYTLMGDVILGKGDLARAAEVYGSVLRMGLQSPQDRKAVEFKLAEILYFQGRFDTCIAALEPLFENSSDDIANDALALSLFVQQFRAPSDEALKAYARAVFLERRRKLGDAAAQLRDLIERFPTAPVSDQAWLRLGTVQRAMDRPRDAAATYEDFLAKNPESLLRDQVLSALGGALEELPGETQRAIDTYQRLLNEHPASIHAAHARQRILALRKGQS